VLLMRTSLLWRWARSGVDAHWSTSAQGDLL